MKATAKDIKRKLLLKYQESGKEMFIDYDDPDIEAAATTLLDGRTKLVARLISPSGKTASRVAALYLKRDDAEEVAFNLMAGIYDNGKDDGAADKIISLANKAAQALEHGAIGREIAKLYVESAKLIIEKR